MMMVATDGAELATEEFGDPRNAAVLLVMGATASMLGWPDDLCLALAERDLFVIRFDHRDTGRSTTVRPGAATYDVEDMAQDVASIIEAYGLSEVHLVGMSLGGYIGQMVALEHPARVATLTLIASEPLGWDGDPLPGISDALLEHFSGLAALDWSDPAEVEAFLVEIDRLCASSRHPFDTAASRKRVRAVLGRTDSLASMFNHAALGLRDDWTGAFRKILQPVLVIHGTEDPVLPPENADALLNGLPDARSLLIEGAGHELAARDHARIVEAIHRHIASALNDPSP